MDNKNQKEVLQQELDAVLEKIKTLGVRNPMNPGGFVATEGEQNTVTGDQADLANEMVDFATNNAILKELEDRASNLRNKIEDLEK